MNQNMISRTAAVAIGAWVVAVVLLATAWVMVIIPGDMPRGLVTVTATTAMMTTGVAMLCHIRLYVARTCSLIRATAGLDGRDELHAVP